MGKKSKKGVSRAGVKNHPAAGHSKAQTKTMSSNSCAGSVMSQDSVSIASSDLFKSTMAKAPTMENGMGPPPLDVLNFVNKLMMQQQLQQQQQQQQLEASVRAAIDQSPCNKENTTTKEESGVEEESAKVEPRPSMVVTLDGSLDEMSMAALIVEKINQVTRTSVTPTENEAVERSTVNEKLLAVVASTVVEPEIADSVADTAANESHIESEAVEADALVLEEKTSMDDIAVVATVTFRDEAPEIESEAPIETDGVDSTLNSVHETVKDVVEADALVLDEKTSLGDAVAVEEVVTAEQMEQNESAVASSKVETSKSTVAVPVEPILSEPDVEKVPSTEIQKTAETGVSDIAATIEVTENIAQTIQPRANASEMDQVGSPDRNASVPVENLVEPPTSMPDVWSSNLREIVDTSTQAKPVLDVTPMKNASQSIGKIDTSLPDMDAPGLNLHTPSPRDVDANKNDCGCIIA